MLLQLLPSPTVQTTHAPAGWAPSHTLDVQSSPRSANGHQGVKRWVSEKENTVEQLFPLSL